MDKRESIPGQIVRNFWHIKPITRIHDNDIRKNKKKQRQISRKDLRNVQTDNDYYRTFQRKD